MLLRLRSCCAPSLSGSLVAGRNKRFRQETRICRERGKQVHVGIAEYDFDLIAEIDHVNCGRIGLRLLALTVTCSGRCIARVNCFGLESSIVQFSICILLSVKTATLLYSLSLHYFFYFLLVAEIVYHIFPPRRKVFSFCAIRFVREFYGNFITNGKLSLNCDATHTKS